MAELEVAPRGREGRPHIIAPAPGWTVLVEVDGALGLSLWRALRSG